MSLKVLSLPLLLCTTGCFMSDPNDLIGHTDRPIDDTMFGEDDGVVNDVEEDGGVETAEPSNLEVSPDSIEISEDDMPPMDPALPLSLYVEDDTLQVEHVLGWDDSTIEDIIVFEYDDFEIEFDYGESGEATRWLTIRYSLSVDSLADGLYTVTAEGDTGEFTLESTTTPE